jgi:acyl-ACP thioesterase
VFERDFAIPYYGLDSGGRAKPRVLLEFFQEAAALHADLIHIGVGDLMKRDLTWVLRRYRVDAANCPGGEPLTVRTWFEPRKNLMSVRRFEARDGSGREAASAWSAWIVVDLKRGRPVRLDRALPDGYFNEAEPTGEMLTDGLPALEGTPDWRVAFDVRRQELDLNGHVNHTVYFDWAMESIPDSEISGLYPMRFDAEFLVSIKRGRALARTKRAGSDPARFVHSIIDADTGDETARLESVWG